MHFCNVCQNMYYIRIDDDVGNNLIYYCRKCGNEDSTLTDNNICVSKTYIKQEEQTFTHIINEYTKHDPTLPRYNSILCPNADCTTNTKDTPREIIRICGTNCQTPLNLNIPGSSPQEFCSSQAAT